MDISVSLDTKRHKTSHGQTEFGLSMILWSLHSSGLPTFYVAFQSQLATRP